MSDERIRVSRKLYRSALHDAIGWTESLIEAGNPDPEDVKRLAAYRRALVAIEGPPKPEPGTPVLLSELVARGYENWPAVADPS